MKPLTTQQEVLLSSDDCNDETERVNSGNGVEQGNGNVQGEIDVSKNCASPEFDKIPNSHRIDEDSDIGSRLVHDVHNVDNDTDATTRISAEEELQHGSAADDKSVVPRDVAVAFNDLNSKILLSTELKGNPAFVEPRNVSIFGADSLPIISEQQDEITGSSATSFITDNGSVLVNIGVNTRSNETTLDPDVFPEDAEENAPSVSTKENPEDRISLINERAAIELERDVFSRLRLKVEDQLQCLISNKVEIAYEKERISKLRELAEVENKEITRLQYELEAERKALLMARAWAEDEAKQVSEHVVALERARHRWERNGIKVIADDKDSSGITLLHTEEDFSVPDAVDRTDNLLDKLKNMAADVGGRARDVIDNIIHIISQFVSRLREWACKTGEQVEELREVAISKAGKSTHEVQQGALQFGFGIKEGAK